MATPVLGPDIDEDAYDFLVKLPLDEDFVGEIEIPVTDEDGNPVPALDPTAGVVLKFLPLEVPISWPAELVETAPGECRLVRFNIDELVVAAARAVKPTRVRLQYIQGAAKLPWGVGRVTNA